MPYAPSLTSASASTFRRDSILISQSPESKGYCNRRYKHLHGSLEGEQSQLKYMLPETSHGQNFVLNLERSVSLSSIWACLASLQIGCNAECLSSVR